MSGCIPTLRAPETEPSSEPCQRPPPVVCVVPAAVVGPLAALCRRVW